MPNPRLMLALLALTLAALFAPQTASAETPLSPENRVRGFSAGSGQIVLGEPDLTSERHYEKTRIFTCPKGGANPGSLGAMRRSDYELNPKHVSSSVRRSSSMLVEKGVYGSFSETFGPGARMPNYILDAPDSILTIMSKSHTVNVPTTLGDILKSGVGRAACRKCYSP